MGLPEQKESCTVAGRSSGVQAEKISPPTDWGRASIPVGPVVDIRRGPREAQAAMRAGTASGAAVELWDSSPVLALHRGASETTRCAASAHESGAHPHHHSPPDLLGPLWVPPTRGHKMPLLLSLLRICMARARVAGSAPPRLGGVSLRVAGTPALKAPEGAPVHHSFWAHRPTRRSRSRRCKL